uniref:GLOBIN domain-containing protein n=1 Tax=Trichuris muris TaxID=70415 RepID=A0A5S6QY75_TRIMR
MIASGYPIGISPGQVSFNVAEKDHRSSSALTNDRRSSMGTSKEKGRSSNSRRFVVFWPLNMRTGRNPDRITFLTSRQRRSVLKSWRRVENKRLLGEEIYIQIFMQKPVLKSLFPFRAVPVNDLHGNMLFTRQAAIFIDFIDNMVAYVATNNGRLLQELCTRVGVSHALMTRVNFDPDWWYLFANSVLDGIQKYCHPNFSCGPIATYIGSRSILAWRILMKYVVEMMSDAFVKQRQANVRAVLEQSQQKDESMTKDGCVTDELPTRQNGC